jgi:hypothetical protein
VRKPIRLWRKARLDRPAKAAASDVFRDHVANEILVSCGFGHGSCQFGVWSKLNRDLRFEVRAQSSEQDPGATASELKALTSELAFHVDPRGSRTTPQ